MDLQTGLSINNNLVSVFGYPLSYIEFVGTITGLISVWLATRSNIWTWPTGLVNVVCFFAIFFQVHLYADMFLQAYFFATSIYGWIIWHKKNSNTNIKLLNKHQRTILTIVILIAVIAIGTVVKNIHLLLPTVFNKPASYPYVDTLVAITSVVATILLAQKKLENWVLWILVDVLSVALYAKKGVVFIAIEYIVFLFLAVAGLIGWLKITKNEKRVSAG